MTRVPLNRIAEVLCMIMYAAPDDDDDEDDDDEDDDDNCSTHLFSEPICGQAIQKCCKS
jgi:hypothetical protein